MNKKFNFKELWDMLNPTITTKRYKVEFADFSGGSWKNFWFYEDALNCFERNKSNHFRVELIDNLFVNEENYLATDGNTYKIPHDYKLKEQINENFRP